MKRGRSHIIVKQDTHPKHALVKALAEKGHGDICLIFASRFSPDFGWTLESDKSNLWLGFSKKSALEFIEKNL